MYLACLTINITYLSKNLASDSDEYNLENYTERGGVYRTNFMVSYNLDDLCKEIPDIKNVSINDFELASNKKCNAFLVPLFEIKDEAGNEIDEEFVKAVGFNNLNLDGKFIRPNTHGLGIGGSFGAISGDNSIYFDMESSLFILKNPLSKKVMLYLFGTVLYPEEIFFDGKPMIKNDVVGFFCFEIWGEVFESFEIDLNANNKYADKKESYSILKTKTNNVTIIATYTGKDFFSIHDTNRSDKHITIKQSKKKTE
ncbi:hypothetical protein CDIK_3254 [Cucumispora dikerogammari]|nr:hypothetical protein CDIK_3254 [Cucumispora dikerogammari]